MNLIKEYWGWLLLGALVVWSVYPEFMIKQDEVVHPLQGLLDSTTAYQHRKAEVAAMKARSEQ